MEAVKKAGSLHIIYANVNVEEIALRKRAQVEFESVKIKPQSLVC